MNEKLWKKESKTIMSQIFPLWIVRDDQITRAFVDRHKAIEFAESWDTPDVRIYYTECKPKECSIEWERVAEDGEEA